MTDYNALRGETGGLPPDGTHDAYLDGVRLHVGDKGESIICDWRTVGDPLYQWTSWHREYGAGLGFTLAFLDGLGIDRASLADTDGHRLGDMLEARVGLVFTVTTKRWGADGAGGVNVTVEGERTQQTLDLTQQTLDLPISPVEPEPVAAGDDDDIPF